MRAGLSGCDVNRGSGGRGPERFVVVAAGSICCFDNKQYLGFEVLHRLA